MTKKNTDDPIGSIPIAGGAPDMEPEKPYPEEIPDASPPVSFSRKALRRKKTKTRSFRWLKIILLTVAIAIAVYFPAGYLGVPLLCKGLIPDNIGKRLNRPVTVGSADFEPFSMTLNLHNVIIGPELNNPSDQVDPVISFSRFTIDLEAESLISHAIICERAEIEKLFVHIVRDKSANYNIAALFSSKIQTAVNNQGTDSLPAVGLLTSHYSLKNVKLTGGKIIFDDLWADKTHMIEDINLALPVLANFSPEKGILTTAISDKNFINPEFSATINGSPLNLSGTTSLVGDALEARLNLELKKIDLAAYLPYLPQSSFKINKGMADLDLELIFSIKPDGGNQLELLGKGDLYELWLQKEDSGLNIPSATFSGTFAPLQHRYHFEEVILTSPEFHVERLPDGHWNFPGSADLEPADNQKQDEGPLPFGLLPSPAAKPDLGINRLQISSGKLIMVDRHVKGGVSENWSDIQMTLESFSTTAPQPATFAISGTGKEKSRISCQGNITADPIKIEGMAIVEQIALARLTPYIDLPGDLRLKDGLITRLEGQFNYKKGENGPEDSRFSLSSATLHLENLKLARLDQDWLVLPDVSLKQTAIRFPDRVVDLGLTEIKGGHALAQRDKAGEINWAIETGKEPQPKDSGWVVAVPSLLINNATMDFVDHTYAEPLRYSLDKINTQATNLSTRENQQGIISGSVRLNNNTEILFTGPLTLAPFNAALDCNIDHLPLRLFAPFTAKWFVPTVESGMLQAKGEIKLPGFAFTGLAAITDFSASTEKGRVVGWQHAISNDLRLQGKPLSITGSLSVNLPFLDLTLLPNQKTSLTGLFKKAQPAEPKTGTLIAFNEIRINSGRLSFTDQTISPPFQTEISTITGTVADIETKADNRAAFALQGIIDNTASITLDGRFGFFGKQLVADFNTKISNLELASIRHYVQPGLGYEITSGKLFMTTDYHRQGDTTTADNSLQITNLKLGGNLGGSPHLPLTIALLTDSEGRVDMKLPIKGSVDDPSFSFHTSLIHVFQNLLLKTAVSPFALLTSLLPADTPMSLDYVVFPFGTAELTAENQKSLTHLAKLLEKRPWLKIKIQGFADSKGDQEAIRSQRQQEIAKKQLEVEAKLSRELSSRYGHEEIPRPHPSSRSKPATPDETSAVKDEELVQLARKRAQTIWDGLVDIGVPAKKIMLNKNVLLIPADQPGRPGNRVDIVLDTLLD